MYVIMIATIVAQEQDKCILFQLQKEWDKLAPLPQQQNDLTTHHTSLCARGSVFYVRREWIILRQGMMAHEIVSQKQPSHVANGRRGKSQLLFY